MPAAPRMDEGDAAGRSRDFGAGLVPYYPWTSGRVCVKLGTVDVRGDLEITASGRRGADLRRCASKSKLVDVNGSGMGGRLATAQVRRTASSTRQTGQQQAGIKRVAAEAKRHSRGRCENVQHEMGSWDLAQAQKGIVPEADS